MAKVKVPVLGTVGRSISVDPDATNGARIGTNLFMPSGALSTPESLLSYLGINASTGSSSSTSSGGVTQHRLLQGLNVGDDHPQYTHFEQNETINGAWTFTVVQTFNGRVDFHATITLNDTAIKLRGSSDNDHRLLYDATKNGAILSGLHGGQLRYGAGASSIALEWYDDASIHIAGPLRVASDSRGNAKDALQSTGSATPPTWVPTGPRYLIQSSAERFWDANEFVRGQNIIGVRHAGDSVVWLPNDLPIEHLISVKDETGTGPVSIRLY